MCLVGYWCQGKFERKREKERKWGIEKGLGDTKLTVFLFFQPLYLGYEQYGNPGHAVIVSNLSFFYSLSSRSRRSGLAKSGDIFSLFLFFAHFALHYPIFLI